MDRRRAVLGLSAAIGAPGYARAASRLDEPADLVQARAREDIAVKTRAAMAVWGLGDKGTWAADLEAGTITFNTGKGLVVTAPVQVIGTYSTVDGTWLWGWDHPSVPAPLAREARLARQFGQRHGLTNFTTRKFACTEDDCWQFTAVACYLAEAQGAYRGPAGPARVFMTYGKVSIRKAA